MPDLGRLTPPYVLLEDRLSPGAGGRLFADPVAIVRCNAPAGVDAAFETIEQGLADGLHAAGLMSYELGHALEPRLARRMPPRRDAPLIWMGLFPPPRAIAAEDLDAAFAALGPPPPITQLRFGHSRARHVAKVREILRLIAAGDVYQVNLTFPVDFRYAGGPLSLYAALRARQPVCHGGVAVLGEAAVLSVSPELWLEVTDGEATTRPMKGTAPRGADPAADDLARAALVADPKQRAENLMIVDLLRNDLARVSRPGSVRVERLFEVETYPSLHTMTSTVTARLKPGASLRDQVAALFPCGSVVGAPKVRAGEIIRDLEAGPRGVYTGALGAIAPTKDRHGGDLRFNVAIRTAVLRPDGHGRYGVGGGIVADSDPDAEYDEARLKARVLTDLAVDYGLIETLRWTPGAGFVRVHRHLARLAASASALGFAFDSAGVEATLCRLGSQLTDDGSADRRVRLELSRTGNLDLTHAAVAAQPSVLRIAIAPPTLDPGDPYLRHKTTRRTAYEGAWDWAAVRGLDEAILLNRRSEAADASRNTLFVQIGDRLITPPLSTGALAGVLRAELLERGEAVEARVTAEMLQAHPLNLGNSLHGLREAVLVS